MLELVSYFGARPKFYLVERSEAVGARLCSRVAKASPKEAATIRSGLMIITGAREPNLRSNFSISHQIWDSR